MSLPVNVAKTGELLDETVQTKDVSSGGVYFEMQEAPQPGSRLEFVLTLPTEITLTGPVQIRCVGRVVRVDRAAGISVGVAATIDRYEFLRTKDGVEEPVGPQPV